MNYKLTSGRPTPLGAHYDGQGVNFAVFSENATKIELCLFSPDGQSELARLPLPERSGPIWHGYIEGLPVGALYGYRAHGAYAPEQGHRFNPNKLLFDPYTRQFHGDWQVGPHILGFDKQSADIDLSFDETDSAPFVAKSVVSDPQLIAFLEKQAPKLDGRDLIYEAHVKGLTMEYPGVDDDLRGTYEGLCSDAVIEHLLSMNVAAIELMPVHSFLNDGFLQEKGLKNYWGYNTLSFFAAEPRYFGPQGIVGFRAMVEKLKAAGIRVLMDVVYNHTAEGDQLGPTLSYRGLDNASYYRLQSGQERYYVNDTGCGNTLNLTNPYVLRMVLDSLRFWVQSMGVDGFRFDLATTLCREHHGFDVNGGFLDAIRQDPILSEVCLIAEPWDIGPGGYRLGGFPPEFREWNDGYRDGVRKYWKGDPQTTPDLASKLLGSANHFDRSGRRAHASVNFITAHDGFTLADLTRYNRRHNLANGENNQDGHGANYSDNCGFEGEIDDPGINARRRRRQRNIMATLLLSQGTPMMLAGDEISNSQQGNNNAYCQDNPTGWINWGETDENFKLFTKHLTDFRRRNPLLRQERFLHGGERELDGKKDVEWTDFSGASLQWGDPGLSNFCLILRGSAEAASLKDSRDVIVIAFNRSNNAATISLPEAPDGYHWVREIDTASDNASVMRKVISATECDIEGASIVAVTLQPSDG